jgi:hypothetical protein
VPGRLSGVKGGSEPGIHRQVATASATAAAATTTAAIARYARGARIAALAGVVEPARRA